MLSGVQIVPGATRVLIEKEDLSLDVIKQHKVLVQGDHQKADILKSYILRNADKLGQMIVFVRTRRAADALTQVRKLLLFRMRDKHSDPGWACRSTCWHRTTAPARLRRALSICVRACNASTALTSKMVAFLWACSWGSFWLQEMKAEGYHCSLLSGEMEKQARDMVVAQFRDLQVCSRQHAASDLAPAAAPLQRPTRACKVKLVLARCRRQLSFYPALCLFA